MAGISETIHAANAVLNAAVKMRGAAFNKSFVDFVVSACSKGASVGHKVMKVLERDATISYETQGTFFTKNLAPPLARE